MSNAMADADADARPERKSLLDRVVDNARKEIMKAKDGLDNFRIGDGHFMAWIRLGFKEVTHMLLTAFPQGQHIIEEPGLWGNPTQGEVATARKEDQAAKQRVAALNEEPMDTNADVSPADLVNGHDVGQPQQQVSPADLLEAKQAGPVQGQQQSYQDVSPADLLGGQGPTTEPPTQRQNQGHSLSM